VPDEGFFIPEALFIVQHAAFLVPEAVFFLQEAGFLVPAAGYYCTFRKQHF
jgi:hypothetical protein